MGRTRRSGNFDREAFLASLGESRHLATRVCACVQIGGPLYRQAEVLMQAIDDLAGTLTGDREHFWQKPHSIGAMPPREP